MAEETKGELLAGRLIRELERDKGLSIEEFYASLIAAKNEITERLGLAADDGVDITQLQGG